MLVAQSGPSHQAENLLTPFPAPPLAAAIGGELFRAQPPANRPPKGDWPEEADLARLTPCLTNPRSLDLTTGDTKMWGQCRSLGSDYEAWR